MPALEITRSMLVNRGLSAINSVEASFVAPDAGVEISNDNALGAFKKFIAGDALAAVAAATIIWSASSRHSRLRSNSRPS